MDNMQLKNKIVWVTGAGQGIGKATALEFAREGSNLIINDVNKQELDATAKMIKNLGVEVLSLQADITSQDQIKKLVNRSVKKFKKIDVLINNAGITITKRFLEYTEKDWDLIFNVNLKGMFFCIKEVLPIMIKDNSGVIINFSSMTVKERYKYIVPYISSKFGVWGLTKSLIEELGDTKIKIYTIFPDGTDTKSLREKFPETNFSSLMKPANVAKRIIKIVKNNERIESGRDIHIRNLKQKLARIKRFVIKD